ncbi:phage baseplate plug family protein [Salibacterium sp. K-3]
MILPIEKSRIPYEFEIKIAGTLYVFEIHYNGEHDFFTVDLYQNGEVLMYGEKLVYGYPLFHSLPETLKPSQTITPLDPSGEQNSITYENFTESVLLYIGAEDEGEIEDE